MHLITPKALYALLKPYENYRRAHKRGVANLYIDLRHGVTNAVGADIRAVTPDGVEVFFYNSCEVIPYDAIKSVTVRTADIYNNLSATEYQVALALRVAA